MERVRDALKNFEVGKRNLDTLNLKLGDSQKGGYGRTYKTAIADTPVLVKRVQSRYADIDLSDPDDLDNEMTLPEDYQPLEYQLGLKLNELVVTYQCPNFLLTYDVGISFMDDDNDDDEVLYFLEYTNLTLAQAFDKRLLGELVSSTPNSRTLCTNKVQYDP